MSIHKADVLKALSQVIDPDLKKDLVSLDMIKNLDVSKDHIQFTVELTTPACPLKDQIKQKCMDAVQSIAPHVSVTVNMSSSVTSSSSTSPFLPQVKNIIAIASGKGGVGKSTVSVNMAIALAQTGARVGLLDADIFGPSIPIMFNCEHEHPRALTINGKKMMEPITKHGVKLISIGFLAPPDSAIVWRGPMASSALKQFLSETHWGELDYLFIDLPPGTSDVHLTMVQSVPITGSVIVTTPQKVALADAIKALAMFKQSKINIPVLGLIENMAWFTPMELPDHKYFIFGQEGGKKLAEQANIPFLGQIPLLQSIRESGDNGKPIALNKTADLYNLHSTAEKLAQQVAIRNAQLPSSKKVEITTP